MLTTQVTLTDQQTQALRSIAQRTGKTEKEVIAEAVEQFIALQSSSDDRQAAQQQAEGMWQDRADVPDLRGLREESDRYSTFNETQPEAGLVEAAPLAALRYDVEVANEGRVELRVPFPHGVHVVVYVIEEPAADSVADLLAAASTSLDFWDNALDDEDWNNA
jgi:hypothetical protein